MRHSPLRSRDNEDRVLRVLQTTSALSLDRIAVRSNYARCTVERIITRLVSQGRIMKVTGQGRLPNR